MFNCQRQLTPVVQHSIICISLNIEVRPSMYLSTLPCTAITVYNALMGLSPFKASDTVLI
ncbi:hypothetical protein BKA93DRAFT_825640 [Sparassis latifolia]